MKIFLMKNLPLNFLNKLFKLTIKVKTLKLINIKIWLSNNPQDKMFNLKVIN